MRKFILILFGLTFSIIGASAMNLKEAYDALSNLPHVTTVVNDTFAVSINHSDKYSGLIQESHATGLNREEIFRTGNAAYAILNQIPLTYMINGGNNGYVCAFIYSTPNEEGTNDLLVVTMSGAIGNVKFYYITNVGDSVKNELIMAKLTMQGSSLSLIPQSSDSFLQDIKINCE